MRGGPKPLLALIAAALIATVLAACGGGDSDDSGTTATGPGQTTTEADPGTDRAAAGDGQGGSKQGAADSGHADPPAPSGEGSSAFRTPGGDNSIQEFGKEADTAEVESATAAIDGFLEARANGEWEQQCSFLAAAAVRPLEQLAARSPQLKGKGCGAILAALGSQAPASSRANVLTDGVASLRIEGDQGFALFHGPNGTDYFMTVRKEDGEWKVGALAPNEFP